MRKEGESESPKNERRFLGCPAMPRPYGSAGVIRLRGAEMPADFACATRRVIAEQIGNSPRPGGLMQSGPPPRTLAAPKAAPQRFAAACRLVAAQIDLLDIREARLPLL